MFTALRLKPGYGLRAYYDCDGGNATSITHAMPVDAPFPEPEAGERVPPVPPGALPDVMEAIEGDGSPWAYLCASIFARELAESGARWHGCDWSTHTILGRNPLDEYYGPARCLDNTNPDAWTWLEPPPRDWRPCVAERDGRVTVTFYTHTALAYERIERHVDTFRPGTYCFTSEQTRIAEGGPGYVF